MTLIAQYLSASVRGGFGNRVFTVVVQFLGQIGVILPVYRNPKVAITFHHNVKNYNKQETLGDNGKTDTQKIMEEEWGKLPGPVVKPFIDKLVIIADVPSIEVGIEIHKAVWANHEDTDAYKGVTVKAPKPSGYARAWRLALPSLKLKSKHWPHLSYAYKKLNEKELSATRLRLEFVPVDLGPQGVSELDAYLSANVPDGWEFFMLHGKVTRIDVAVDLLDLTMDDFHYLHPQGITAKEWRLDGSLGTFQVGKEQGKRTRVYDRGAKRKAYNSDPTGKTGVRIERVLMKQKKLTMANLVELPNPLTDFTLVERCPGPPRGEKKSYIWDLFMSAANQVSLTQALALLPIEKRTLYRKHLKKHVQPWWNPKESWKHWPAMLESLGMVLPAKSVSPPKK